MPRPSNLEDRIGNKAVVGSGAPAPSAPRWGVYVGRRSALVLARSGSFRCTVRRSHSLSRTPAVWERSESRRPAFSGPTIEFVRARRASSPANWATLGDACDRPAAQASCPARTAESWKQGRHCRRARSRLRLCRECRPRTERRPRGYPNPRLTTQRRTLPRWLSCPTVTRPRSMQRHPSAA